MNCGMVITSMMIDEGPDWRSYEDTVAGQERDRAGMPSTQLLHDKGLTTDIGWQNREYLSNLGLSDTAQAKFYQGMIAQKGTQESVDKLLKSNEISDTETFDVYEQYAFKIGNFGAVEQKQDIEIKLKGKLIKQNP